MQINDFVREVRKTFNRKGEGVEAGEESRKPVHLFEIRALYQGSTCQSEEKILLRQGERLNIEEFRKRFERIKASISLVDSSSSHAHPTYSLVTNTKKAKPLPQKKPLPVKRVRPVIHVHNNPIIIAPLRHRPDPEEMTSEAGGLPARTANPHARRCPTIAERYRKGSKGVEDWIRVLTGV